MEMSGEEFEGLVADALDAVPRELLEMLDNVVVLVEDESAGGEELLGLYEGIPQTERWDAWGPARLPDRITIFHGPTLRTCHTVEDVRDEVTVTVVHEIAHHFGIDDQRLHDLGWG